jgi:hypothetical protein
VPSVQIKIENAACAAENEKLNFVLVKESFVFHLAALFWVRDYNLDTFSW